MAEGVVLRIDVEQFTDATACRIYDKSVWNGKTADVLEAKIILRSNKFEGERLLYLISPDGSDRSLFEMFVNEGFINAGPQSFLLLTEFTKAFPDGYYEFELVVLFAEDLEETSYTDNIGFMAFMESEGKRVQLAMPSHETERFMTIHVYLYAAKAAASVGQISKFLKFVDYINGKLNNYKISYL
jgi:hypothetical protein